MAFITSFTPSWFSIGNQETGPAPDTPGQFFGSNNDFDVIFKRNSIEIMRMSSAGLLIGLTGGVVGATPALSVETSNGGRVTRFTSPAGSANQSLFITRTTTVGAAAASVSIAGPIANAVALNSVRVLARQTSGGTGVVGDGARFINTISTEFQGGVRTLLNQQSDYAYTIDAGITVGYSIVANVLTLTVTGVVGRNLTWSIFNDVNFAV